jgi:ankyrin repeat protein
MDNNILFPNSNKNCSSVASQQVLKVTFAADTKSVSKDKPQSACFQNYEVKQIKNLEVTVNQWIYDSLNQDVKALKAILKTGFDINSKSVTGATALHLAVQENQIQIVEFLLKNKAQVDITLPTRKTPLYIAAEKGFKKIVAILLTYKANPNIETLDGFTPLQIAIKRGHQDIVELLKR